MSAGVLGSLIIALPALALVWLALWRRHRPVFWFAVALIVVGVGYLFSTGATSDVARWLVPNLIKASSNTDTVLRV